ncbi:MAG: phosphoglycerate dehydrogenase [Candidatus Omnitrophota bacterium]
MKVLISDSLSEEGLKILNEVEDLQIDAYDKVAPEKLKEIIGGYDALIVRSGTKVTRDIIECGKKLRVIGRAGVGLDNVDAEAASEHGIIVMNTPEGNTIATAEHTMSLLLAMARNIPRANESLRQGKWERKNLTGVELYGKILGIVGLGRVGSEVAKRCRSFGMRILAFDPFLLAERASKLEVELVPLEDLLRQSDFITVHTPLTKETKYLIGAKELDMMKKGVRVVNCARGGIVEEKALLAAIQSGKVAGAAIDVFEEEPPKELSLVTADGVVATPHLGASTNEAQINVAIDIAKQVVDALLDRGIRNAVNYPSVDGEVIKVIRPYLKLAENIGALQSQLVDGRITNVKVRYSGEPATYDTTPITVALVKGLLTPVLGETVNYVNAQMLAKNRGITVTESKTTESEEFTNLIATEVKTDKLRSIIDGALFSKDNPRIVKIDEFYVDAVPHGHMIITFNKDVPGIIGAIGTILGRNNINIAGMTFGRRKQGGRAITVLNVDSPISEAVLKEISSADNIYDVRQIVL